MRLPTEPTNQRLLPLVEWLLTQRTRRNPDLVLRGLDHSHGATASNPPRSTAREGVTDRLTQLDQWGDPGPTYTEAEYGWATEATFNEVGCEPGKVTARPVPN